MEFEINVSVNGSIIKQNKCSQKVGAIQQDNTFR